MPKTALGFRVRSGGAAAVVLEGPSSSPRLLQVRRIELSDPGFPESRQPFHAVDDAEGDLESDEDLIRKRVEVVHGAAAKSIGDLLADCHTADWKPRRAGIVTGSLIEPSTIGSPHIRAHAMEGRLFRTALEGALRSQGLECVVLGEKTVFGTASDVIGSREPILRRTLVDLGRGIAGPWRADEKLAALAAWVAVSQS
jgi:hypothetical protein